MVIFPARTGAYPSITNLQKEGGDFVKEYYARHLGADYAEYLMKVEQSWISEYSWATYVDWGLVSSKDYKRFTKECGVREVSQMEL